MSPCYILDRRIIWSISSRYDNQNVAFSGSIFVETRIPRTRKHLRRDCKMQIFNINTVLIFFYNSSEIRNYLGTCQKKVFYRYFVNLIYYVSGARFWDFVDRKSDLQFPLLQREHFLNSSVVRIKELTVAKSDRPISNKNVSNWELPPNCATY